MGPLLKLAAVPILLFLALAYAPGLLDISPVYFNNPPPRPFKGTLEPNDDLNRAEKLLINNVVGPESITFYRGALYTGLANGWIVRIIEDHIIEPIATIGNPNCKPWEPEVCGRVGGIRINRNGTLLAVDIYHGLYDVNPETGLVKPLYQMSQAVDGKRPKMLNDFDMAYKAGDIYISETSHKYEAKDMFYGLLESAPSGRILHHNLHTNTTRVLVDGLAFPNGVQLSPRKDFLLFNEMLRKRVMKYHLRGPDEGKLEVFLDNLPGFPDNIRPNDKGGYWVAIVQANTPEKGDPMDAMGRYPLIRKVVARTIHLIQSILNCIEHFCPSRFLKTLASMVSDFRMYKPLDTPYGMILEVNKNGDILRSLHSPDGYMAGISEVALYGDTLYFGSPENPYLGKLTLDIKTL